MPPCPLGELLLLAGAAALAPKPHPAAPLLGLEFGVGASVAGNDEAQGGPWAGEDAGDVLPDAVTGGNPDILAMSRVPKPSVSALSRRWRLEGELAGVFIW